MVQLNFNAGPAPAPAPLRVWSTDQQNLFDFAVHGQGHAVLEAVAGSGKSTTIKEACSRIAGSSVFIAFNKAIVEDLKAAGVNARTFHSICFMPVLNSRRIKQPDADKLFKLCKATLSGDDQALYGAFIRKLVGLARNMGVGTSLQIDCDAVWYDLIAHHDMQLDSEYAKMDRAVELARALLDASNNTQAVDFDDMLYFAVRDGIRLPTFDFIFVDEMQDTNAIQRAIVRKLMHAGTRIIAVGDPAQAIYGFRGADSQSMDYFVQDFNAIRLPLSTTYRCAQSIVRMAQQWVPHIQAAPNAPEGEVVSLRKWDNAVFGPKDLVVCRTTKPLIELAYRMLRDRIPVKVMGKEIGQGLKTLINKMNAYTLDALTNKLEAFRDREVQKAVAKGDEGKAASVADRVNCILFMIDTMEEGAGIRDLMNVIDSLFSDKVQGTTLATIHKAKGLEADTVFWLNSSKCPSPWARQDWQRDQENNLMYVAVTRAKSRLVLIEEGEG